MSEDRGGSDAARRDHAVDLEFWRATPVKLSIGLICLFLGLVLYILSRIKMKTAGLPGGQVIYSDTGTWEYDGECTIGTQLTALVLLWSGEDWI